MPCFMLSILSQAKNHRAIHEKIINHFFSHAQKRKNNFRQETIEKFSVLQRGKGAMKEHTKLCLRGQQITDTDTRKCYE